MNNLVNPLHFGKDGKQHGGLALSDCVVDFVDNILIFSC